MKYAGAGSFQRNRPLLSFAAGYAGRMADYSFRIATQDDIQAITDIYNAVVIRGGRPFTTTPAYLRATQGMGGIAPRSICGVRHHRACHGCSHGRRRTDHRLLRAVRVFYDRAGYDGVTDLAYHIAPNGRAGSGHLHTGQTAWTNAETATCAKPAASSSPTTADPSH